MQIDIRKSIQENFRGASIDEIKEAIVTSIETKEELALPGLGVFFEMLWNHCSDTQQQDVLDKIKQGL